MRRRASALVVALTLQASGAGAFVWPSTVDHVTRDLRDPNPLIRRRAARRLFDLSPDVVKRIAVPALDDADPGVRVAALEGLMEARARGLGARVSGWLGDGDPGVRRAAAVALAREPAKDAVAALGRVLSDPESSVRIAAARALGAAGTPAAAVPLLGRLDDSDPDVREAVVGALSHLGDPASVVPLAGRIQDNRPSVRRAVATALGLLGDARASGALLLLLRDSEESVRAAALEALGRLRAEDAVATIVSLLGEERRPSVREAAYGALASIPADSGVDALVDALSRDDPRERSPIRAALARAGERAVGKLVACLQGQPSPDLADGAALTLGEMKASVAATVVDAALRRGVVRPRAALRALGASSDPRALVTVLEYLSSEDPWVRGTAIESASDLLDPARPDGRAVEPVLRALDAAHGRRAERIALAALLGRTGAPTAAPALVSMARDVMDATLRLTAIQALGLIAPADQDGVLLDALRDPLPRIRLAAAMALRRRGSAASAASLLERVERAAAQDRGALLLALAGPLSRTADAAVLATAARLLVAMDGPERDLLVEALAAVEGARGSRALVDLAPRADWSTRAKIAEALGAHPEAVSMLRVLARDVDPSVRANAVWSLGAAGAASDVGTLESMLGERNPNIAGNAAAALARLGARGAPVAELLCRAAQDDRPYVRTNAFVGLLGVRARCPSGVEREALARDRSELVRVAAARLIAGVPSPTASGSSVSAVLTAPAAPTPSAAPAASLDRNLLRQCISDDRSGVVAAACALPPAPAVAATTFSLSAGTVSVYVVPTGATEPTPRAPFALVRADGLVRLGVSDRRGEVSDSDAPRGALRLEVPAPLAE